MRCRARLCGLQYKLTDNLMWHAMQMMKTDADAKRFLGSYGLAYSASNSSALRFDSKRGNLFCDSTVLSIIALVAICGSIYPEGAPALPCPAYIYFYVSTHFTRDFIFEMTDKSSTWIVGWSMPSFSHMRRAACSACCGCLALMWQVKDVDVDERLQICK